MRQMVSEIEVVIRNNKKYWVIIKNDYYPDTVGEITSGPYEASDMNIGTKYRTELTYE
jgi:hypothetical protein